MLLDKQAMFSDGQDLSQVVGTYLSDKSIDLGTNVSPPFGGTPIRDVGRGKPVQVLVQIDQTFTSGGAATLQAKLVMADNEALDSNLVILQSTEAIALATLVAGYQFRLGGTIPPGISKRYLGIQYVIAGATTTAGTVTAAIVDTKQTNPTV